VDKQEIKKRAIELYAGELQYAIAGEEEVDLDATRHRAAMRLGREMEGQDMSPVWVGYVQGIARDTERGFEVDASGQLRFGDALRVRDLTFVPTARARERDWLALDARHEEKLQQFAARRSQERDAIRSIIDRLRAHGGDPTTFEACPDLFPAAEAVLIQEEV